MSGVLGGYLKFVLLRSSERPYVISIFFKRCASRKRPPKAKTPDACWRWGFSNNSLTMTYFHTGCSTIIGAKSFHGPVRDGKGWDQLAMVIRHDLSVVCRAAGSSPGTRHIQPKGEEAATSSPAVCRKAMQRSMSCLAGCEYRTSRTTQRRYAPSRL